MKKIIIAGAGITGLSTGFHLKDINFEIFEKESEPGGLARSKNVRGFNMDYGGHFIHGKDPYFLKILESLFSDELKRWERRAAIFKDGKLLPYPFQANLSLLSKEEKFKCIRDFIETSFRRKKRPKSFREWLIANFGEGICKSFLFPYNSKFWIYPLESMSYEWCKWAVPVPSWEDALRSALGEVIKGLGYNPVIYYPKDGIGKLPQKLMENFKEKVFLGFEIKGIDLKRKIVSLNNGEEKEFDLLVSTIPLKELIELTVYSPAWIKETSSKLRYISIFVANSIAKGRDFENIDWVYLPEKWTPFYRIGFYPEKKTPFIPVFAEISALPGSKISKDSIYMELFALLRKLNILERKEDIEDIEIIKINYAYVIFDDFRRRNLTKILKYFERNGVITAGRYGSWDYFSMEKAFLQGKEIAEKINKIL
ncbi:MAG: protoporphyrinogen/coproporphyrinogen oxidase [Candidatus Aminicenantia bacterium]